MSGVSRTHHIGRRHDKNPAKKALSDGENGLAGLKRPLTIP